ncbi:MAG: TniB family NTP-binding protein [Endomicrobia bacterium]|nr:TniB family NTP-binding protein [Endomicrobiia bacterium]
MIYRYINLEILPRRIFLKVQVKTNKNYLKELFKRYEVFVVQDKNFNFELLFNNNILNCKKCSDKNLIKTFLFNNMFFCYSQKHKEYCYLCPENKYLFDSILRIAVSIILSENFGLLIHSAGIIYNSECVLYVGPTNSGKSTLSKKYSNDVIISDELCPVVVKGQEIFSWKSMFYSEVKPKIDKLKLIPLKKIYFLDGISEKFKEEKVSLGLAFEKLLKNTFWIVENNKFSEFVTNIALSISSRVKAASLYLKRDEIQN